VQHVGKDAGVTSSATLAFPAANAAGHFIAVAIRAGHADQTFTVTDTARNTYQRAVQLNESVDGTSVAVFYAENIVGGANAVTVSDTVTGGTLRFAILEYAGVAMMDSLEGAAASHGFGVTASSGVTSTIKNGDVIIGVISSADPRTFVAGIGYTVLDAVPAAPNTKLMTAGGRQALAGPTAATATMSAATNWGAVVAAFKVGGNEIIVPPAPTISAVLPIAGPAAGGTAVTISGTNFAAGATIAFGGVAAKNVTVLSSTSIVAQSPAHAAGPVTVEITTPDEQTAVAPDGFTYVGLVVPTQPISFVQVAAAAPQSSLTTVRVTYPLAQTAGDLNVVVVGWNNATSTVANVQDSAGNSYSLAIGPTTGAGLRQSIYYAPNIRGGSNVVTVAFDQSTAHPDIRIMEYRGVSSVDVSVGSSGNSLMSSSDVAETTSPNELIVAANMVATFSIAPGTGFTRRVITSPDGDIAEDRIVSDIGIYGASAPLGAAGPWVMQMVTFR
jgi:hypothetical protein